MNTRPDRLDGPTASELGLSGMKAALYERMMTNHHEGHRHQLFLGGCHCIQITADEVEPGDFRYHYSNQLDAFTLWEVMSVNREKGICELRTIDTDGPEVAYYADGRGYWDGEHPLKDDYDRFYRPDPADRFKAERDGFKSQYEGGWPGISRPVQHRYLNLRIYYRTPKERIVNTLKRWFLGT